MTVVVESPQTITATPGGVATFAVGFSFESADELQVFVAAGAGAYAVKTLGTHYTLTGTYLSGGASVVFQAGSVPAAGFVKMRRETAAEQPTGLGDLAAYKPSLFERMMDRFTRQLQEAKRDIAAGGGGGGSVSSVAWDSVTGKPTAFTPATHDHATSEVVGLVAALALLQPLHANLTAFAGLTGAADKAVYFTGAGALATTTLSSFARTLLDDADAATMRATLGVGSGVGDMVKTDNLSGLANYATARANLGLTIGTHVQAYDADLAALAGLTSAADKLPYFTGSGTAAVTAFTAFARTLLDDADAATMRATLGVGSGTGDMVGANNLSEITVAATARSNLGLAALAIKATINGGDWSGTDLALADGGTGASTASAARTNLGLVIGTDVQAYDGELAALAGLTSAADRLPYFTGSGTAALATFTAFGRSLADDADAAAGRSTLGLGSIATQAASAVAITGLTQLKGNIAAAGDFNFTDGTFGVDPNSHYVINRTLGTSVPVGSTTEFAFHINARNNTTIPWSTQKGALFVSSTGYGAGETVTILSQAYSGGSGVSIWAGVFDSVIQPGHSGGQKCIEMGCYNYAAEVSNIGAGTQDTWKSALWIGGSASGANRATAAIAMADAIGADGFFYGMIINGVHTTMIHCKPPMTTGATGIFFENSASWGDLIRSGVVGKVSRYDGVSSYLNVIRWDGAVPEVVIGSSVDAIKLDLTALSLGVRQIKVGANGSGPGGSGHALYVDH